MARLTASLGRTPGPYDPPPAARELTAVSADGARIHVEVHGAAAGPAVVLAHGWSCSTAFWAAVIRELTASGHRVVTYDQRGHGRTPGTRSRGTGGGARGGTGGTSPTARTPSRTTCAPCSTPRWNRANGPCSAATRWGP